MSSNGLANGYGIDGTKTNAGSSSNPYALRDYADLNAISSSNWGSGVYYRITNDIDCNGSAFGFGTSSSKFIGEIRGNLCTISNFDYKNITVTGQHICSFYGGGTSSAKLKEIIFSNENYTFSKTDSDEDSAAFIFEGFSFYKCILHKLKSYVRGGSTYLGVWCSLGENCKFSTCIFDSCTVDAYSNVVSSYNSITCSLANYNIDNSYAISCTVKYNSNSSIKCGIGWNKSTNVVGINNTITGSNVAKISPSCTNCYSTNGGSSASSPDGLKITSTQYKSLLWWWNTVGFDFTLMGPWTWDSAKKLPKLRLSSTNVKIKISDSWKSSRQYIKINGVWTPVIDVYCKENDEWRITA